MFPWRRLFLAAVVVVLGAAMLTIPWILPAERGQGRALVFLIAGAVELVLGITLAYLVLRGGSEGDVTASGR